MKKFKKLAYVLILVAVSGFPYYFKTVAQSYSWVTQDTSTQAFLGFFTIGLIGMAAWGVVAALIGDIREY